ncbi:MAG TPA: GDP-mannose 4,6-dehydratase [Bellilinea sp.]|nr:GDP-mannose 4,6-dehydratase [Bellilinea sp.]
MTKKYLVTGGAGFIGSNFVARLLNRGEDVKVFDNLSRAGSSRNLEWLKQTYGADAFQLIQGDVRDADAIQKAAADADVIVHLAAQVAVTTSVVDPRNDFEINALGTFNALEAARLSGREPVFLYSSTNKVYGGMEDVRVVEQDTRYAYADYPMGISEEHPLDFHSPYGCSKGSGDQYVRDYARIYGIRSVVFRQSCIYGVRQFGVEDQGWVAWFVIAALKGLPISVYGDGKQVRDVLFVDDLTRAYDLAIDHSEVSAGEVFNIGGGASRILSVWNEFGPILEKLLGHQLNPAWGDWRPGDQRVYVSDIRKAEKVLGWKPEVGVEEGITRLFNWVKANPDLF